MSCSPASPDVVCNDFLVVLVCIILMISVCMFIVSKALLILSATVLVRAVGAIWLNPFDTVLFTVCSAVTVECCFCTCVGWLCLPLTMSPLVLGMGTMAGNLHMCDIMLLSGANMLVSYTSQENPSVLGA